MPLTLEQKVINAGNQICKWWKHCRDTEKGHFDNVGYKHGLKDCLQILKKHHVIKDYSLLTGVELHDVKECKNRYNHNLSDLSFELFDNSSKKRLYFAYELLYHIAKGIKPKTLDRLIDAALEQTDVNIYNAINVKKCKKSVDKPKTP